ncbi:DUF3043 family protein [Stackebrandtia endophytica]|uniref:DUF3043 family protein n=1 Tax=Stackebrandtia endophytica TaxID=1496996 RepID=A0A543B2V4_9ACTN|nr:DUF3043 domain-containing protein [Stackebrandtia endophytica]TQL79149.1 DUF3043 family protein [Stackebrandtia endophytica]
MSEIEPENHALSDSTTETEAAEEQALDKGSGSSRDKSAPTPKRQDPKRPRPPKNPPMNYKEARQQAKAAQGPKPDKEAKRARAAERRAERQRVVDGQNRGDPLFDKYHMPRDKGPERLLVRDLVDARRSIGQYFFIIAIAIMFLSTAGTSVQIQQFALLIWVAILLAFIIDSILLCRKTKNIVWSRFPKTKQRKAGIYWYAISRSMMFRRMRQPLPRPGITYKTPKEDLGKVFRQ